MGVVRVSGRSDGDGDGDVDDGRGQLVLLGAAVLAVALVPLVLAYLQLGYHADVAASADYDAPAATAERFLDRAVADATDPVAGTEDWSDRADAVDTVHARLDPHRRTLAESRVVSGTATRTAYNQSAARAWARSDCPGGPDRQFGPCEARRGVVVQERAGETHVLAVALDVTVTTERGVRSLTVVERVR